MEQDPSCKGLQIDVFAVVAPVADLLFGLVDIGLDVENLLGLDVFRIRVFERELHVAREAAGVEIQVLVPPVGILFDQKAPFLDVHAAFLVALVALDQAVQPAVVVIHHDIDILHCGDPAEAQMPDGFQADEGVEVPVAFDQHPFLVLAGFIISAEQQVLLFLKFDLVWLLG